MTPDTPTARLDEALPCPFCGEAPEVSELSSDHFRADVDRLVRCATEDCAGNTGSRVFLYAWNRRAPAVPEKPQEAVAGWRELALRSANALQKVAHGVGPLGSFHGLMASDLSDLAAKLSKAAHVTEATPSLWWLTDPDGDGVMDEACVFPREAEGRDYIRDAQPDLDGYSLTPLYAHPVSPAPASEWDTDVRLVLSEVATWITLAHHRDGCHKRHGESCSCGRDSILAKLKFSAPLCTCGHPHASGSEGEDIGCAACDCARFVSPALVGDGLDRAERVHNLRCAHRLRREFIAEMLLAASNPAYEPPDNAVDVGRTVAVWGTR